MSITLHDEVGEFLFKNGEVVFRIKALTNNDVDNTNDANNTSVERYVNLVTSKDDYEKQLQTHVYNPLLYACSFLLRLAYLYGCLNRRFDTPRDERFIFSYRFIGKNEWYEWFTISPVKDLIF